MPTFTAASAFREALFNVGKTILWANDPQVLATLGMPAFDFVNDVVSFGAVTSAQNYATMSSSRRSREETLTCEVIFYSFSPGGQEQEQIVNDRAYSLLSALEFYCRITDTTLGGVVRECFLTEHASDQATDQTVLSKGRLYVITSTFTALARISS